MSDAAILTEHTENNPAGPTTVDTESLRTMVNAATFGDFMSVLIQSPRHQGVTLGTLSQRMVPAFLHEQYVLAKAKPDNTNGPSTPVGCAFWASVSPDVDARLEADSTRPIDLAEEEWKGGDIIWLIEVVGTQKVSEALVKSIRDKVGAEKVIKYRSAEADGSIETHRL